MAILGSLLSCGPGAGNSAFEILSSTDKAKFEKYLILGKDIYNGNCKNCHQSNGLGLRGIIPPLSGSDHLQNFQDEIPCLLANGSKDSIKVNGILYPPQMPAHNITNLELAVVITFINNSWGNEFGFVKVKDVDKLLNDCD
jgi:mono/diheme cytochrome c family protein